MSPAGARRAAAALAVAAALLAGCGPQAGLFGNAPPPAAEPPTIAPSVAAPARAVPAAVRVAVAAAVARMQGKSEAEIGRRLGVQGAGLIDAPDTGFRYQGFAVRSIVYQPSPPPEGNRATAFALVGFEDRLGRSAAAQVAVRYTSRNRRLVIEGGEWRTLPALAPRTALYVVPLRAIEGELGRTDASWERLYAAARRHGLPLREAAAVPRAEGDHVVLVFWRDALPQGATVSVGASSEREGLAMWSEATRHRVFPGGFVVSALPARFAPAGGGPIWIKAAYAPGPIGGPGQQRARLVGLYGLGGALVPGS